ncbi:hypothetical protein EIN_025810 [Entamoeba invadens IP1]|uniref:hypothetical protein n=1 Tax=Entamoeba invadens IP1 TaxID=370355 RepID=UPI0002C3CEE0|nr:hypothetical protein EIN_025810 [Entamoeba invadens IP1]ELP90742.1 hypothetical protein EIN_025810 [Entamoeba invadens IP1]|eukprot:XP_004257513.1 hypothetical protein EIN_025810 [Entamoeba invadens IP1]
MALEAFTVTASAPHKVAAPEEANAFFVLQHASLEGSESTQLYAKFEEATVLLCTLSAAVPQHSMSIPFMTEEVEFSVKGKGTIHVIGNFDIEEDDFGMDEEDMDDMEGMEDMEDDEEEEPAAPVKVAPKKEAPKKEEKKVEKKPVPKEEKKPQHQEKKETKKADVKGKHDNKQQNKKHGKK